MPRVRLTIAVVAVLLLTVSCGSVWREKPVVNHWAETTGGESLERSFWRDIESQNLKELVRHVAGNYLAVTPEGKLDRSATLTALQQFKLDSYSLSDFQVELNATTLVVTYTASLQGTYRGQALQATRIKMMGVWQHQKSGWVAIAHSVD